MKKQLLSFALVLTMSACSAGSGQVHKPADNNTVAQVQAAATPNKEFTQFLEDEFKETLENDYTTLHQNVADPEKYGFDMEKVDVTLGDFLPTEEDKEELAKTNEKLKAFDYETLDKKQQELYDEYIFTNALAEEVYSGKYALSSTIYCAHCGDIFQRTQWIIRNEKHPVWRCACRLNRKKSKIDCPSRTLYESDLHAAVIQAINQVIAQKDDLLPGLKTAIEKALGSGNGTRVAEIDAQLEDLEKE